jgi:hypothetical protein
VHLRGSWLGKQKKYLLKEKIFKGALKGGYRHILSFRETGKAEVRGLKTNRGVLGKKARGESFLRMDVDNGVTH